MYSNRGLLELDTSRNANKVLYSSQAALEITVILLFIFIIGAFRNTAFFLLLARVKTMRTIANFHLANLSAADLMIFTLEIFYDIWCYRSSIVLWNRFFFHKGYGCILFSLGYAIFSCASIFLIIMVSFDQYLAVSTV